MSGASQASTTKRYIRAARVDHRERPGHHRGRRRRRRGLAYHRGGVGGPGDGERPGRRRGDLRRRDAHAGSRRRSRPSHPRRGPPDVRADGARPGRDDGPRLGPQPPAPPGVRRDHAPGQRRPEPRDVHRPRGHQPRLLRRTAPPPERPARHTPLRPLLLVQRGGGRSRRHPGHRAAARRGRRRPHQDHGVGRRDRREHPLLRVLRRGGAPGRGRDGPRPRPARRPPTAGRSSR